MGFEEVISIPMTSPGGAGLKKVEFPMLLKTNQASSMVGLPFSPSLRVCDSRVPWSSEFRLLSLPGLQGSRWEVWNTEPQVSLKEAADPSFSVQTIHAG